MRKKSDRRDILFTPYQKSCYSVSFFDTRRRERGRKESWMIEDKARSAPAETFHTETAASPDYFSLNPS
jgi:hypothetical protein